MVNIKSLLGERGKRKPSTAAIPLFPLPPPLPLPPRSPRSLPHLLFSSLLLLLLLPPDKATNPENSEPDWETILDIVEEIKQKNVS